MKMPTRKDYDILFDQYNVAIAKVQDLQEQMLTKQKQWDNREEHSKVVQLAMRDFCEEVLARDNKEMVLGADYSWASIPILELINKAQKSYREETHFNKDFMRKLLDETEIRRQTIESLEEQIAVMRTQPSAIKISQEELVKQIEDEKKKQKIIQSLPQEQQKNIENGKSEVVLEDESDVLAKEEEALLAEIAETSAKAQINPKSVPYVQNRKNIEKKKERKQSKMKAHTINLKEFEEKLDPASWDIIEIMGKEGTSIYSDIEAKIIQNNPLISTSKCRTCIGVLTSMGLTKKEPVLNPLKGRFYIYALTDTGARIYQDRYQEIPVISEMERIATEHDNCGHGYGIKFVADLIREEGDYKEVSDVNRKHPISCGNGVEYIPDIICTEENGHKMYIEYECVNHTQSNFNAKCNKMACITDVLNFIVPNNADVAKIRQQISRWIENQGQKALSHITVRVIGAYQLRDTNMKELKNNKSWKLVFKPGERLEPYENI